MTSGISALSTEYSERWRLPAITLPSLDGLTPAAKELVVPDQATCCATPAGLLGR
jgi:hypothetical protein